MAALHAASLFYIWPRCAQVIPPERDPVWLFENLPDSGFPIRRVDRPGLGTLPRFELTLDPSLADRLGWQTGADDLSQWFDANAKLVATAFCRRDGSPDGQMHGDCLYGKGAAITLTEVGRTQIEA